MDKIALFNGVAAIAKPPGVERKEATSMDDEVVDLGFDSLDTLLLTIYLCDVYGVPEETLKQLQPGTVTREDGTETKTMTLQRIFDFMEQHKTKEPGSLEEALSKIK